MRTRRIIAAATTLGLLAAAAATGPASAVSGVGTAKVSTTVLGVELGTDGSLLGVRVLGDDGQATTDSNVSSVSEAFSALTPVSIASTVVPGFDPAVTIGRTESRTPGGQSLVETAAVDVGALAPAAVATGTVSPATLSSAVDTTGSRSALTAALTNLSLVGGLVSAESVASSLTDSATPAAADATRSVTVGAVAVLDLGALLDGLGISLADLPVPTVSAILDQLNASVAGLPGSSTLASYVSQLETAIDDVTTVAVDGACTVTGTIDGATSDLLGTVGLPAPTTCTTVTSVVDQLDSLLDDVLENGLAALENLSLLKVDGATVAVGTKATDTLEGSSAGITAAVGAVSIGGIVLPGVDLASTATAISDLVAGVNSTVNGALANVAVGQINLGNLVDVAVLEQTSSVTASDGYNRARAGLTVLRASITPPADLAALVAGLVAGTGIGEAIEAAGGTVPGLSSAMTTLEATLGGGLQALSGGATVRLVEVLSASDFAPVVVPAITETPRELPRTGGTAGMAALAVLLGLLGMGIHRRVIVPARQH